MANNYTETEVKLYVPDLHVVRTRLEAARAVHAHTRTYERNVRYENADTSLTRSGVVLRLRKDTRVRLTVKEESKDAGPDGVKSRFEAEVEVSSFDDMDMILKKLGFRPYLIYEKYRTTYELDKCEIMLDEMPYGNFVEIEGEAEAIPRVRQQLGLEDAPNFPGSYTALFDRVRRKLDLSCNDLTFEDFAGISVPPSAFEE